MMDFLWTTFVGFVWAVVKETWTDERMMEQFPQCSTAVCPLTSHCPKPLQVKTHTKLNHGAGTGDHLLHVMNLYKCKETITVIMEGKHHVQNHRHHLHIHPRHHHPPHIRHQKHCPQSWKYRRSTNKGSARP